MKKNLTYLSLEYRKFSLFLVFIILILGVYNYIIMPRQEVADVSPPLAQIVIFYPGGSPEDIENLITEPIEKEVSKIKGFDESSSVSKKGVSIVKVFLDDSAIPENSWIELNEKIDDIESSMPEGTMPIKINTDLAKTAGMIFSISGKNYDYQTLGKYSDYIQNKLINVDGVESFDVLGDISKQVEIIIDYKKLNQTNLSIEDISKIIKSENIKIPSGDLEQGIESIKVNTKDTFKNLNEVGNIIIKSSPSGQITKLKDIAEIKYSYNEDDTHYSYNGKKTILLTGYFKSNNNNVSVGKNVEKKLDKIINDLPKDLQINKVSFQPDTISDSVNKFIKNLLQAVFFVILVVFLGMGFTNAIIVSITIPFAIATAFISMNYLGIKLEQMSITALIISLGMLVDNSIVVIDSIQYYIDKGLNKFEASIKGANDVSFAMFTSSLTTIIAFSPLLFIKSAIGDYLFGIPSVVIITLIASYLCAQLITPIIAYIFLNSSKTKELKIYKLKKYFKGGFNWSIRNKRIIVTILIISIISTGLIFKNIQKSMFPKANKPMFYINITSEKKGNMEVTESIVKDIEKILVNDYKINEVTSSYGNGLPKFYMTVLPVTPSKETAQILAKVDINKLKNFKTLTDLTTSIQKKINKEIINSQIDVKMLDMGTTSSKPINFKVIGSDLEGLKKIADNLTEKLTNINGTIRTKNSFSNKIYELQVNIDKSKARIYQISSMDINKAVSFSLKGIKSTSIEDGKDIYNILVKSNVNSKKDLENIMIKSSINGKKVLLKSIADIKLIKVYPQIEHFNGTRVVEIESDIINGFNPKDIEEEIKEVIKINNYNSYEFNFEGEMSRVKESFLDLFKYALIALLFIFALLILQFNSYLQPIIIFISVVLSFVGALAGLYFSGQPLSFTALLGLVSLMGIVVNNAIVLIDYMNRNIESVDSIKKVCQMAIERRFRPIILSTTTTIVGLTPLLITSSEMFRPMATVIISGLFLSTSLTLIIIPMIYYNMEKYIKPSN
ncbi:MAG: efflux RND transporter permease subunit [Bacillota bacterium]